MENRRRPLRNSSSSFVTPTGNVDRAVTLNSLQSALSALQRIQNVLMDRIAILHEVHAGDPDHRHHSHTVESQSAMFEDLLARTFEFAQNLPQNDTGCEPATEEDIAKCPTVFMTHDVIDVLNKDEVLRCSICQEPFVWGMRAKRIPCGHLHCVECIEEWLRRHRSCPVCRTEVLNVKTPRNNNETTVSPDSRPSSRTTTSSTSASSSRCSTPTEKEENRGAVSLDVAPLNSVERLRRVVQGRLRARSLSSTTTTTSPPPPPTVNMNTTNNNSNNNVILLPQSSSSPVVGQGLRRPHQHASNLTLRYGIPPPPQRSNMSNNLASSHMVGNPSISLMRRFSL
eukprot:PhF_6_TR21721/c0_g1_i2/m.31037